MKDCGLWKSCFGKRLLGVTRNSLLQPWRGPPAPCGHFRSVEDVVQIADKRFRKREIRAVVEHELRARFV